MKRRKAKRFEHTSRAPAGGPSTFSQVLDALTTLTLDELRQVRSYIRGLRERNHHPK